MNNKRQTSSGNYWNRDLGVLFLEWSRLMKPKVIWIAIVTSGSYRYCHFSPVHKCTWGFLSILRTQGADVMLLIFQHCATSWPFKLLCSLTGRLCFRTKMLRLPCLSNVLCTLYSNSKPFEKWTTLSIEHIFLFVRYLYRAVYIFCIMYCKQNVNHYHLSLCDHKSTDKSSFQDQHTCCLFWRSWKKKKNVIEHSITLGGNIKQHRYNVIIYFVLRCTMGDLLIKHVYCDSIYLASKDTNLLYENMRK